MMVFGLAIAAAVAIVALPLQDVFVPIGATSVPLWSVFVGILVCAWIVALSRRTVRFPSWSPYHWPTLVFAFGAAIVTLINRDAQGLGQYWHLVAEPIILALIVWTVTAQETRTAQLLKVGFGAMIVSFGILEIFFRTSLNPPDLPRTAALLLPPVLAFFFVKLLFVPWNQRTNGEQLILIGTFLVGGVAVASAALQTDAERWISIWGTRSILALPFAWLLGVFVSRSLQRMRSAADLHSRAAVIGFLAAMGTLFIQPLVTGMVIPGQAVLFWVLLGLSEPRPA